MRSDAFDASAFAVAIIDIPTLVLSVSDRLQRKPRSIDMTGYPLVNGVCAAVFALCMGISGNASAWPTPVGACSAENDGEYAMTSEYSLLYVEYATYVCSNSAWQLLEVSRCYYLLGRCTPL